MQHVWWVVHLTHKTSLLYKRPKPLTHKHQIRPATTFQALQRGRHPAMHLNLKEKFKKASDRHQTQLRSRPCDFIKIQRIT